MVDELVNYKEDRPNEKFLFLFSKIELSGSLTRT